MAKSERHSEDWVRGLLTEQFEYVGGYTNIHSDIVIRCKECGYTFTRTIKSLKDKNRKKTCPNCIKIADEKSKEESKARAEKKRAERQARDNKIIELRKEGCSINEIARQLNVSKDIVRTALRKVGLDGFITGHGKKHSEEWVQGFLDEGFEYVGGFKNVDSYITIKCKECGYVFERSMIAIRHKERRTTCPECKRKAKIQREIEQKEEAERRQREQTYNKLVKQFKDETNKYRHCKQTTMRTCKCCGNIFFTDKKTSYCSKRCMSRAGGKKKDHARRIRMKEQMVDSDITIERLFERDNGKCAICGGECDWNDYTRKNNFFVAGNFYPSIDHIIPLSKGGEHSWDNVQLAHRVCNSRKSNTMPRCV